MLLSRLDTVSPAPFSIAVGRRTTLQTGQAIIERRIADKTSCLAWRGICSYPLFCVEAEYCDIILVVKDYKSLTTELYLSDRSSPLQVECHTNSSLTKDIDLAWTVLGIIGADSEEGLNRFVCEGGDLRVDTVSSEL